MKLAAARTVESDKFLTILHNYLQLIFSYLYLLLKYCVLSVLLILLASHETANPKIGKTNFEFYSTEFRQAFLSSASRKDTTLAELLNNDFYVKRMFLPAWTMNFETNDDFETLTTLIKNANHYGLFPSQYHYRELIELKNKLEADGPDNLKLAIRYRLESLATEAGFRFLINLALGVGIADSSLLQSTFVAQLPQYFNHLIGTDNFRSGILAVQPANVRYKRLQSGLVKFLSSTVVYEDNYTTRQLKNNDSLIAQILLKQGYLTSDFIHDSAALISAIRNFQRTNALKPTGKIDRFTLKALTISTSKKFYKIALNLDRIRKDDLKKNRYILVNIPEFKLHYYDENGNRSDFPVVVGKAKTPTPLVSSQVEHIIANPFWTVPRSITVNEILPRLKYDTTYLERNGFMIIDNFENQIDASSFDWKTLDANSFKYWFRQKNSRKNALGVIKFLFPNDYSVYLHDTPSKSYFNKEFRAFSHGCVRVKNPEKLAEKILKDEQESKKINLKKMISDRKHKDISLDQPIPIFIRYNTCSADSAGNVYFYPDIYSEDDAAIQQFVASASQPL